MLRRLLSLLFLASLTALAQQQKPVHEIRLRNGDRLTGEILEEGAGKLFLRSPVYGDLQIPEDQIIAKHALSAQEIKASSLPAPAAKNQRELLQAAANLAPTPSPIVKPAQAPIRELPQWKKVLRGAKGSLEFGYNDQFGRVQSSNTSFNADAEYTAGPNNYKLSGKYYYGEYDGELQSDRREAAFRYRHDLSQFYFLQGVTSYTRDKVKAINLNVEQSAGLGWAAIRSQRQNLNLGGGILAQSRQIYQVGQGTTGFFSFFQDYDFKINDRITFKQDSTAQYSPIDRARYSIVNGQPVLANDTAANFQVRFNATLQGKLTHRITANLRYEYEYDNTIIDQRMKSDKRISTTLGYAF